jgi:hypothetical protein
MAHRRALPTLPHPRQPEKHNMSSHLNTKAIAMALVGGVLIAGTYAFSPAPTTTEHGDHENNLKVLPKDISHEDLMDVMHSFEVALNFNCGDCHTHSATDPGKMDFAADTKNKTTAIGMMKMVQAMDSTYFGGKGDFKTNYLTSQFKVTCISCHNGHDEPANQVSIPIPRKK